MKSILLDTHAWAWSLYKSPRLSAKFISTVEQAEAVFVSPVSFFEIGQKVRIGKWPEMEAFLDRLVILLGEVGGHVAALTPEISLSASRLDWAHRDPFDRMLAATAIHHELPLISADTTFDTLSNHKGWVGRVW
ncbi:type II toxin-antitoxin system VapC family toxin [Phyllobacterium bourgognense]|uniref:PIN domain nuclease of toxin-antitoxin system n=1 Tax=Phyllobacterium bourgognense TaxID=314236 RepID=A0A368ZB64_9HYPH|nr:type II toxin-antitoxin system VapC family toxin [Phyllobacterium bourgognense]RCW87694.1 PIN domain nuclease of toxin-antitoxin system [Phyllobacterium bourgognense]